MRSTNNQPTHNPTNQPNMQTLKDLLTALLILALAWITAVAFLSL
jgi:hypothetical protein